MPDDGDGSDIVLGQVMRWICSSLELLGLFLAHRLVTCLLFWRGKKLLKGLVVYKVESVRKKM